MISTSDRKTAVELIEEAHDAGARYHIACNELGITLRTLERWKNMGENCQDKRPYAKHPTPANALSAKERQAVLDACHSEEFSSLPPGQIVPILADRGTYLASESTFYRILREYGENTRRSRSKPPTKKEVVTHEVDGPNQVWTTDISCSRTGEGTLLLPVLRTRSVFKKGSRLRGLRGRIVETPGGYRGADESFWRRQSTSNTAF